MNKGIYGLPKSKASYIPPYKVYTALLTQSSTNPPTAIVLENTIGNIYWTYEGVGVYNANLIGAFTLNKTYCPIAIANSAPDLVIPYPNGDFIEFITGDGILNNTPIEIRVYP